MVREALRRASSSVPCVFFLPRLDAWALNTSIVEDPLQQDSPSPPQSGTAHQGLPDTPTNRRHPPKTSAQAASLSAMSPFTCVICLTMLPLQSRFHLLIRCCKVHVSIRLAV